MSLRTLLVALLMLAVLSCRESATRFVVRVTADRDTIPRLGVVRVTAQPQNGSSLGTIVVDLADGGPELPGQVLVTLPEEASSAPVRLTVEAVLEGGARIRQSFSPTPVKGQTTTVYFLLSAVCANRECSAGRTCVPIRTAGACAPENEPVVRGYGGAHPDVLAWGDATEIDAAVEGDVVSEDIEVGDVVSGRDVLEEIDAGVDVPSDTVVEVGDMGRVEGPEVGDVSGIGDDGPLADHSGPEGGVFTPCAAPTCEEALSCSDDAACALRDDGEFRCWGAQTPLGIESQVPRLFTFPPNGRQFSICPSHICVTLGDGTIECWGDNRNGTLGDGTFAMRATPFRVGMLGDLTDATQVAVCPTHSCARRSTGEVICWGANADGQLGSGRTSAHEPLPVRVVGLRDAVQVVVGSGFTCALRSTGAVVCWGSAGNGHLGNGLTSSISAPSLSMPVTNLTDAVQLSTRTETVCAIRRGGQVVCWGLGIFGQIGDGGVTSRNEATAVSGLFDATSVGVGTRHVCARRSNGSVSCWGQGAAGQLGNNSVTNAFTPVSVMGLTNARFVASGNNFSCATSEDGYILCWGENASGQLGNNRRTPSAIPVRVVMFPRL